MITRYLFISVVALIPQDNHAPVVKIQSPAANMTASTGSSISYEITVADQEDGDSRYDEINPKEVVLMIRAAGMSKSAAPTSPIDPLKDPGLATMARSNCFNCHQFNGRLIGPSLAGIARRYGRFTAAITDSLTRRIKDGSTGIWGKEKMPSHPEVGTGDIRAMLRWIEKYAAAPGVTYQNGTSGVLQFPAPEPASGSVPEPSTAGATAAARPGIYTLTAAYTDHGTKDTKTGPYLTGLDQLTFIVK
ncbi:MAG TPA: c-type cytochrome [Puia sp.]|nr:c-type cytochrome [Puia sp.]